MKLQQFEFNMFGVNTYVAWNPATLEAAVIDPGMSNRAECQLLADFISRNNLKIVALLNTHLHIDHLLGDEFIERNYGVGLQAGEADTVLLERLQQQAQMFHLRIQLPETLNIAVCLNPGDRIHLGNEYFTVLSVPGHSPGSLAFYCAESGFVITGDALFRGSIGRTDLPGGHYPTLVRAITENLLTLPPATVVYPGHGPTTTIANEIASNPFL